MCFHFGYGRVPAREMEHVVGAKGVGLTTGKQEWGRRRIGL